MSGYVPGYLVPYNLDTSNWPNQNADYAEITVSSINEVAVLIPNGAVAKGGTPYFGSAGLNGGANARRWWVSGDVSNIGGVNYTEPSNDPNNGLRDEITTAYIKYFKRFAGPVAMENWCWTWLYGGGQSYYGTIDNMIYQGGKDSGESTLVATKPYWIPYTYYDPKFGCTNSTATNYAGAAAPLDQRLFTTPVIIAKDSSCTYITASLSASPTEILNGSSSTLSWSTKNATSNSINNGVGSVGASGNQIVYPTSTTTYTLTASNSSNSNATQTASATVTVRNLPTASITVTPNNANTGDTVTLSWSTTNAQSLTITDDAGNNVAGASPAASGSIDIVTKNTTTSTQTINYTLNVTGYLGKTAKATATLKVAPALRPYINSGGVWNRVDNVYIKDAGVWKLCTAAYVKDGGVWKQFIKG